MLTDDLSRLGRRLARNLRRFRLRSRLRQEDMEQYGVPYKYYQSLERPGKRPVNPTLKTLIRLAGALRVPVYKLFQ